MRCHDSSLDKVASSLCKPRGAIYTYPASIKKIESESEQLVIHNHHVVAQRKGLDDNIQLENHLLHSIETGIGIVNHCYGTGDLYLRAQRQTICKDSDSLGYMVKGVTT